MKSCNLYLPKKSDLGITKYYRGIIPIGIAALHCFSIVSDLKLRKFFGKIETVFRINSSTTSQVQTIRPIIEGICAKNLEATLLFINFHTQRKDREDTSSVSFPKEMALQRHKSHDPLT